jgi:DNA-binding beta-propeller fold protein YncE
LSVIAAVLSATIALAGGPPASVDYLAYDAANHRVWVPAGNTGNIDVIDTETGALKTIGGMATAPSTRPDRPRRGPSSASVGPGVVWVGNRADGSICSFDAKTLAKRTCVRLEAMPDGVQYVATTQELWVTTPREQKIAIVDTKGKTPAVVASIPVPGRPEGYAVDAARGIFYTNLEDKDATLALDIKTRKVVATWSSTCGGEGPRGIAIDGGRRLLFVACTDGVVSLDLAHDGKKVGRLKTGSGVDNIDYLASRALLYVASGEDGMLTVAHAGDGGALTVASTTPTAKHARNAIVDQSGTAYVPDSLGARLIVIKSP